MFKLATSYLGISPFVYYDMTPKEILLMFEGHTTKFKNEIEIYSVATKIAIFNAMKGKNHKVFAKDKEEQQQIDPEYKQKELNELKKIFS